MEKPLRVLIDAQIESGGHGGAEQLLIGLIRALGRLKDGPEEYLIIGLRRDYEWLLPHLGENERLVFAPPTQQSWLEPVKRLLGPLRRPAGILQRSIQRCFKGPPPAQVPTVLVSDGFYESLGADVFHILYPLNFVKTDVPTLFTICDLQHRHYPKFFPSGHMAWRETVYPVAFSHAKAISVISEWVKQDVVRQYGVDPKKMSMIHLAPITEFYKPMTEEELGNVRRKFRLPDTFVLYPALTYEHKNHVRLLEAIALLRDRDDLVVHLICVGQKKLFWPAIEERLRALRLANQVRFLGFISQGDLCALYHLAQHLIFPSLFEGAGMPVMEALQGGTPVACSDIPSLREYVEDAALFFDPTHTESIAEALRKMGSDAQLLADLRRRGLARASDFSWARMAKSHRALYRKVAGRALSEEDQHLIGAAHPQENAGGINGRDKR